MMTNLNNSQTKEEILTKRRAYYQKHKEKIQQYNANYRQQNKKYFIEYYREYREIHNDELNAYRMLRYYIKKLNEISDKESSLYKKYESSYLKYLNIYETKRQQKLKKRR